MPAFFIMKLHGTHLGLGELEVPFEEQKRSLNSGYDGSIRQLSNPHLSRFKSWFNFLSNERLMKGLVDKAAVDDWVDDQMTYHHKITYSKSFD
jgi:hypothetical protein